MKAVPQLFIAASFLLAFTSAAILREPAAYTQPPIDGTSFGNRISRILQEKKQRSKGTDDALNNDEKPVKKHKTNKGLKELKKYAVSSLVGIISTKLAASSPGINNDNQQAIIQKNIEGMFSSPDLDRAIKEETKIFTDYLKSNNIQIPKGIKLKDMKQIVKKYSHDQYNVDSLTFDTVEPIATKVYKTIRSTDVIKA